MSRTKYNRVCNSRSAYPQPRTVIRVAGEKDKRVWPISRMPLLINEEEWHRIGTGVAQRAELLERVLADIYGEGRMMAEGVLPLAALTGSTDYIAAMRGVKPPGGRWLRLYAVDIGRGPDGSWWALNERSQAPSGCGYALENRLVVSQAFPNLYAQLNVVTLALFFRSLSAGLKSSGQRAEPRIGILTLDRSAQPISNKLIWRATLAFCWSKAKISLCATGGSSSAPSPVSSGATSSGAILTQICAIPLS